MRWWKGLRLDESEQRAVRGGGGHANAVATAKAGRAERLFRRRQIGRNHKTCRATCGKARERHAGVALAKLFGCQEYEVGTITTRWDGDCTVRLGAAAAVDHAGKMRGFLCGFRRDQKHLPQAPGAIGMSHQFRDPDGLARL